MSANARCITEARATPTLPDLLTNGLTIVFVGINPSIYAATQGHYFARPSNRFWPCFSQSVLSAAARRGLGVERLRPEHDRALSDYGIGFTDVVKRPTVGAADVTAAELRAGAAELRAKVERYRPQWACFHGVTAYRDVHRALVGHDEPIVLGAQAVRIATARVFVIPNPSGANAHVTRAEQTAWYDRLAATIEAVT